MAHAKPSPGSSRWEASSRGLLPKGFGSDQLTDMRHAENPLWDPIGGTWDPDERATKLYTRSYDQSSYELPEAFCFRAAVGGLTGTLGSLTGTVGSWFSP